MVDVDVDVEVVVEVVLDLESLPHPTSPTLSEMAAMATPMATAGFFMRCLLGSRAPPSATNPRRIKPRRSQSLASLASKWRRVQIRRMRRHVPR